MEKNRNLALVGKVNLDIYGASGQVTSLGDTKDFADGGIGVSLGGASANVARSINTLSRVYGDEGSTKIVTRIGEPPEQQGYNNFGEHLLAQHAAEMTFRLLQHEGVNYTDVAAGKEGPGIAKSVVSNFRGGRHIFKQMPLQAQFAAANDGMVSSVHPVMTAELSGASYVFVDPARPALAKVATDVCEENRVPSIVDHGLKSWPKDELKASLLEDVLKNADILIVPADAFVPGMRDGEKNPDKLFETLSGKEYKARTIIMSDGTDPVRLSHHGKVSEIPVTPAENPINVSGAGDTRDGALMFFLSRGDEMETAVAKATEMATIRIQYPGNDWEHHIYDHVKDNPLFADDMDELDAMHDKTQPGLFDDLPNAANDRDDDLDHDAATHG
ncbi:MAG: carbohydrate kinase family protein [Alcanivorax sp.]